MKWTITGATAICIGITLLMIRRQDLKMMWEDNDYFNKVYRDQLKMTDQNVYISNQPWI